MQDPSIQDNPLSKQCNTSTCYAAPVMQPHLLCKHLHQLLCRTSNATPAMRSTCCLCKPPQQIPAKRPLLSDTPTKMIEPRREIYRNLGRNSSLNFRHKPTLTSQLNHSTTRANKQTYTHEMLCNLLNYSGHESLLINF